MAQVDCFLKVAGIDGEASDAAFPKHIEVDSWSWGETNSGTHGSGGGGGAGKVAMQDMNFVTKIGQHSASLAQACATGQHIPTVELNCRKAGDKGQVYFKVKLSDVLVSSYQTGGSSHGDVIPTDQMSFNFARIEFAYGKQDAKGKVNALDQKFGYDLKLNKKI